MKSIDRSELLAFLNELLQPQRFNDYCPNGLQVEGSTKVSKIVTGVSANQALIAAAIEQGADTLIVHHGYFWKGEPAEVIGIKRQRLALLLQHNINLIAYHLPLDIHPELGNNALLAQALKFPISGYIPVARDFNLPWAELSSPMTGEALNGLLHSTLGQAPIYVPGQAKLIRRVAWCTGAAEDFIEAVAGSVDAYITGEISERTYSLAQEAGLHFYAAGHHATERFGVRALACYLKDKLEVPTKFLDIFNPI